MVPIIDLARPADQVATDLDEVCSTVGFFQITGHGADASVIDAAWHQARDFFDLPIEAKVRSAPPWVGHPYGYLALNEETLANSLTTGALADLKETFNAGPIDADLSTVSDPDEALLRAATPWPDQPIGFRPALEAYWREMDMLAGRVMAHCARALGLDDGFFDPLIDQGASALRVINYPDQAATPPPGQLRAGAHTDYGTLTILRQDDAPGGLEVQDGNGRWVPVPSVPDAFVVNIGDLLARWTNDRWRSTMHRVVNPPAGVSARRQSIAFFHNANFHCRVECLPTCSSAENPPRYAPVLAGPHLVGKFQRTR